eukprot:TRINITY_DN3133_c0_g1_i1.p1 TRINITY_DN3133_c0_g1~~TRINITY_DN3133_c0_g1_i1.p1  ORF type:complete len:145 (+),score=15.51 TRINITY_DN3133_c0_g1_i1:248-682(+)
MINHDRRRVAKLSDECDALRSSFGMFIEKKYEDQRTQLLGQRKVKSVTSDRGVALAKEGDSLDHSLNKARDIESQTIEILAGLYNQNRQIRGMVDKMHSFANTLGISRSIMRVIDRRQQMDKNMVYGGMVAILLLIIFMYWFVI